jgi:hypothetical protein
MQLTDKESKNILLKRFKEALEKEYVFLCLGSNKTSKTIKYAIFETLTSYGFSKGKSASFIGYTESYGKQILKKINSERQVKEHFQLTRKIKGIALDCNLGEPLSKKLYRTKTLEAVPKICSAFKTATRKEFEVLSITRNHSDFLVSLIYVT